jgi:DNA-binding transcriptional MocR family regulator
MTAHSHHNAKGRSTGRRTRQVSKYRKPDTPFAWVSAELLNSPAWQGMSTNTMRVVHRLMLEDCQRAGSENGRLPVTHEDFIAYGCSRNLITEALAEAESLGLVRYKRGGRFGETKKPSIFRLTWFGTVDAPATNEWKGVTKDMVTALKAQRKALRKAKRRAREASQDSESTTTEIYSSPPNLRVLHPRKKG